MSNFTAENTTMSNFTTENTTMSNFTAENTSAVAELVTESGVSVTGVILTVVFLSLGLFICAGNLLVIVAIRRTPELQTNTNAFVSHLAVADFIIGFQILLVRSIFEVKFSWLNTYVICYARFFASVVTTSASGSLLCGVAVVRFVAILKPLRYASLVTTYRTRVGIVSIWVYSLVLALPCLIPGFLLWDPSIPCEGYLILPGTYIHYICINFMAMIVTLVVVYSYIGGAIYKQLNQSRVVPQPDGEPQDEANARSEFKKRIKSTQAFVMVVGVFVISYIPFCFLLEMQYMGFDVHANASYPVLFKVSNILRIINSAVNPVIYALRMTSFRGPMKNILCFCMNKDQV